jgi:NodT family efflux transporter outer membrane factor (OMF) lipoprotein
MFRTFYPGLLVVAVMAGCAAPQPLPQSDLLPLALGKTELPADWKQAKTPGEFDGQMLGFELSPELKKMISEAQLHNTDLRQAASRVAQSRATLKSINGGNIPSVALGAQGGVSALPTSGAGTSGAALIVNWELDLWGRTRSDIAAADARLQSAELDTRYARDAIAAAVVRAWLATSEAQQQMQLTDEMLRLSEKQLSLKTLSQKIGRDSVQDVAMAEAAVASYRNQQALSALTLNRSQRALEILLGRYPSASVLAADTFPQATWALPAGLPSELLGRRPDVMAAEQRFRAAFLEVAVAKRARYPSISLVGGAGYVADSTYLLKQDLENPLWALTGQLLMPLFTGGQLKGAVDVKNAKQEEAVAGYAKATLNALNEVEDALANEQNLALRQQALADQLAALQKSLQFTADMISNGRANQYQLQQEQLNLTAAKAGQLHLLSERLANRIALHQALGGHFPE